MAATDALQLGLGSGMRPVLQTEAAECGLACLAMLLGHHGTATDLPTLRSRHGSSAMGCTLADLSRYAEVEKLATRAVRLEMAEIGELRLPCVLHWDLSHFVVLVKVRGGEAVIYDPAIGERRITLDEMARHFSGVAMEAWPDTGFRPKREAQSISLRALVGRVTGLWPMLGRVMALSLALEVFALTSPLFMQWVVDHVLVSQDRPLLLTLAVGFVLVLLVQQAISAFRSMLLLAAGTMLKVQWRSNVFTHLLRLPLDYFAKRHLGDILSRFESIDRIQAVLTASLVEALLDGLMAALALVLILLYSPMLAGVAVLSVLAYLAIRLLWYPAFYNATAERLSRGAREATHFIETVRGARTIRLFGRQHERRAAWQTLMVGEVNAGVRVERMSIGYRLAHDLLAGLFAIAIVALGAQQVLDGQLTVGMLLAFIAYRGQFDQRVTALVDKAIDLRMLRLDAQRLADIVLTEPEPRVDVPAAGSGPGSATTPAGATIEFQGVGFRYAANAPWVLQGLDLTIPPGQSIAIAGPSGCGKTTLVNLLLGVYPAEQGTLRVGGRTLGDIGLGRWRAGIGTVMQDDVLFAGTLADNITFFDPRPDMAWMEQCAKLAAIEQDIVRLPMGWQTLVGDMGAALSGGQKQRVLLARALYRRPSLLVLDEATSHLDLKLERAVNASIAGLKITRIVVAHRPQTLASVDRVVELHEGRVVRDLPARDYLAALQDEADA
jgi:ATP-binding cassette, subfamily B, bacterial CvaB/MchF/RaxB